LSCERTRERANKAQRDAGVGISPNRDRSFLFLVYVDDRCANKFHGLKLFSGFGTSSMVFFCFFPLIRTNWTDMLLYFFNLAKRRARER